MCDFGAHWQLKFIQNKVIRGCYTNKSSKGANFKTLKFTFDGELTQRLTFEGKALNQGLAFGDPKHHLITHDGRLRDLWRGFERIV